MADFFDLVGSPVRVDNLQALSSGWGVLPVTIEGLEATDTVKQMVFTASPRTGAGSSVTKTITPTASDDGQIDAVPLRSTAYTGRFTLLPADLALIAAGAYEYAVRVFVERDGETLYRDVQAGKISARASVVSKTTLDTAVSLAITGTASGSPGETDQLTATVLDVDGAPVVGAEVTWSSSNTNVATVDATGLVEYVAPGTATITATCQSVSDTATATCTDPAFVAQADEDVAVYVAANARWEPKAPSVPFFAAQRAQGVHWVTDPTYGASTSGTEAANGTAINAAITAAAAVSGKVIVPGLFPATGVLGASNVEIEGHGEGSGLTSATAGAIILHLNGVSNAAVRRLPLTHSAGVRDAGADCLRVTNSSDVLLEDVHTDGGAYGIRVTGDSQSERVKVVRPHVENAIESGILMNKALDCVIDTPHCHHNGSTSLDHGIYISDASANGVTILNPTCEDNGGSGIQIGGEDHAIIGGVSRNNGTNGLINSLGSNFSVNGLRCTGNTNRGVYLAGGHGVKLTDVECVGNGMEGLVVQQSDDVKVNGGKYSENVRDGILADGSVSGNAVNRLEIIGATCKDNDSADSGTYSGVRLLATAGTVAKTKIIGVIARNTGATGQIYGVSVGPNVTATDIASCELFGNKTGALLDSGINTRYDKPTGESSMTFTGVAVTLTAVHDLLRYDVAGGSITQALPPAANCSGREYTFIKTDASANTITLDPSGAETINGSATYVLTTQYQLVRLRSTGTAWYVVSAV